MEGVMMKSPTAVAMAVRKEDGSMITKVEPYEPWSKRNRFFSLPIVRGCVSFVESLVTGMKAMTFSTEALDLEEEEPSKFEIWLSEKLGKGIDQVVIGIAVVFSVILSVGLFIALPSFLSSLIMGAGASALVSNLLEGLLRVLIFIGYLLAVSQMKEIKRVFMYHGAEHKTIACYEADLPLTVENARKMRRLHPRCGTNYLFLVMMVSILFFSLLGFTGHWALKILLRIVCLPIVAGLSYEVLRAAGASDSILARIVRWPGMKLQLITTKEPDDSQLEVAILAFELAEDAKAVYAKHPEYDPNRTEVETSADSIEEGNQVAVASANS